MKEKIEAVLEEHLRDNYTPQRKEMAAYAVLQLFKEEKESWVEEVAEIIELKRLRIFPNRRWGLFWGFIFFSGLN